MNTRLVNTSSPPPNAIYYKHKDTPFFLVIAKRKNHGLIPGYFNGKEAVYAYGGKEFIAPDFDWIVIEDQGIIS